MTTPEDVRRERLMRRPGDINPPRVTPTQAAPVADRMAPRSAEYVLYVIEGDAASGLALAAAKGCTDVEVRNARAIAPADRPSWLLGAPTLECKRDRVALTGIHAVERLRSLPRGGKVPEDDAARGAPAPAAEREDAWAAMDGSEGKTTTSAKTGKAEEGDEAKEGDLFADFEGAVVRKGANRVRPDISSAKITQDDIERYLKARDSVPPAGGPT